MPDVEKRFRPNAIRTSGSVVFWIVFSQLLGFGCFVPWMFLGAFTGGRAFTMGPLNVYQLYFWILGTGIVLSWLAFIRRRYVLAMVLSLVPGLLVFGAIVLP